MMDATLIRLVAGDTGTFGVILFPDAFALHTLELPWENNQRNISCIPCGIYSCEIDDSARWGSVYHIRDVPERSYILFHPGNWAGRKSMPHLQSNVEGCILLGQDRKTIQGSGMKEGQLGISSSRKACDEMTAHLKGEPFELLVMSRIQGEPFVADHG